VLKEKNLAVKRKLRQLSIKKQKKNNLLIIKKSLEIISKLFF
jgi:hypothetical protein